VQAGLKQFTSISARGVAKIVNVNDGWNTLTFWAYFWHKLAYQILFLQNI